MRLYRPVGLAEWEKIQASGEFPPRLDWQPIFYPVLVEEYAIMIARNWNTKDPNSGFVGIVTQFEVSDEVAARYPIQVVGGRECQELWVPSEELPEFNARLLGPIQIVHVFYGPNYTGPKLSRS